MEQHEHTTQEKIKMIREFEPTADLKVTITMKNSDRNHPLVYRNCDIPSNLFELPGWISFWVEDSDEQIFTQVPLDQVNIIEMYQTS